MLQLENSVIKLRALEPEDLSLLYQWENNTAWWLFGNTVNPFSKYILREYIVNSDKTIYDNKQLRLMIQVKESSKTIGMIDLYDFDPHHNRAGIGIVIDELFQSQGYAQEAISVIIHYAFDFLTLHSLYAYILPENQPSIAAFMKSGFEKTATIKDWLRKKETYLDVEVYQLINKR
jgi:diamine N-acetyltransferase